MVLLVKIRAVISEYHEWTAITSFNTSKTSEKSMFSDSSVCPTTYASQSSSRTQECETCIVY